MKTSKRIYGPVLLLFVVLLLFAFAGMVNSNRYPIQYDILKRIPAGNFLLFSAAPKDFCGSEFVQLLLGLDSELEELKTKSGEVEDLIGVNPMDIERITVFCGDPRKIDDELGTIIQVDAKNFHYDLILSEFKGTHSSFWLSGYNVQMFREDKSRSSQEVYLYHDDKEIVITTNKDIMEKSLDLKRGKGPSLADDSDFVNRMNNLKYNKSLWVHLPTDKIIEDILGKVNTKRPDILKNNFEFRNLLCGINLSSDLKFNVQIYNPNEEQLTLTYDLFNGLKALGMLSLAEVPELKEVLDKIELNKEEKYFEIDAKITMDDIKLLLSIGKGVGAIKD